MIYQIFMLILISTNYNYLYNKNTDNGPTLAQWAPWVGDDLKVGVIPLVVIIITGALASLWIDLSRKPIAKLVQDQSEPKA